ncbi:OapC/ArvC family zinc-ribbon domain-containing protein [Natrinema caseinilyticum]|uniref:OapC/ArvC family zinc-ribbon domain-containing protein n=1 Tax=Natrinema caseinilyticum TaxID=2961570 RepID=UPI0020C2DD7E|nr:Zn-ribbon containing protein [Natrinema caseinilyticum]
MPHQCTNCGRTFADGSKEMLSGCPDCGGNKFQFAPTAAAAAESFDDGGDSPSASSARGGGSTTVDSSDSTDPADPSTSAESSSVTTRAAKTVRDWVSTDSSGSQNDEYTDSPEHAHRNRSDSAGRQQPDRSHATSRADNPWPSSAKPETDESSSPTTDEFAEWPESARRPEDRSGAQNEPETTGDGREEFETTGDGREEFETTGDGREEFETTGDGRKRRVERDADQQDRSSAAPAEPRTKDENAAQADARSEVFSTNDLPSYSSGPDRSASERSAAGSARADSRATTEGTATGADDAQPPEHGRVVSEPSGERPSIEELRAELNEQFESIKIVRPGQYELNLMELYNRDEYIISLQEDGRYVIDVPDSWRAGDDGED